MPGREWLILCTNTSMIAMVQCLLHQHWFVDYFRPCFHPCVKPFQQNYCRFCAARNKASYVPNVAVVTPCNKVPCWRLSSPMTPRALHGLFEDSHAKSISNSFRFLGCVARFVRSSAHAWIVTSRVGQWEAPLGVLQYFHSQLLLQFITRVDSPWFHHLRWTEFERVWSQHYFTIYSIL